MPWHCYVPKCTQKGYTNPSGEKVSLFTFPNDQVRRKQWIHAIRREEGKNFTITDKTKVCSLHFRPSDLKKSLNGRIFVRNNAIPSKFEWALESPKKRKAPAARVPLPTKVAATTSTKSEIIEEQQGETDEQLHEDKIRRENEEPLKSVQEELEIKISRLEGELREAKHAVEHLQQESTALLEIKISRLEGELREAKQAVEHLQQENTALLEKQLAREKQRLFDIDRFKSDEDISFYTGFPKYTTFLAIFEFLNPGAEGENIRYCAPTERDITEDFYDEEEDDEVGAEVQNARRGRPKILKPIEELFMVM